MGNLRAWTEDLFTMAPKSFFRDLCSHLPANQIFGFKERGGLIASTLAKAAIEVEKRIWTPESTRNKRLKRREASQSQGEVAN